MPNRPDAEGETFTDDDVILVLRDWLEFGEKTYGTAHKGAFSRSGWQARCLRFHLAKMKQARLIDGMHEATNA